MDVHYSIFKYNRTISNFEAGEFELSDKLPQETDERYYNYLIKIVLFLEHLFYGIMFFITQHPLT